MQLVALDSRDLAGLSVALPRVHCPTTADAHTRHGMRHEDPVIGRQNHLHCLRAAWIIQASDRERRVAVEEQLGALEAVTLTNPREDCSGNEHPHLSPPAAR